MSQSIRIACHKSIGLFEIKKLLVNFYKNSDIRIFELEDEFQIQGDIDSWYITMTQVIDLRDIAIEDFKEINGSTDEFKAKVEDYIFYYVRYNNFDIMKKMIKELLLNLKTLIDDFWLDNDYGVLIKRKDFLSRIENDEEWDWRTETPF